MSKKILIFLTIFCFLFSPFTNHIAKAAEFSPGYIISDSELRDYASMSLADIEDFLAHRTGAIKYMKFTDIDGVQRSAAEIISRAAITHGINPKYLLVLLQKEQSLIEDPAPSQNQLDWATGYAVCDSCSKDDPDLQKFRGFATQVDRAAWRNKYYIEHPMEFGHLPGKSYNIDGQYVFIYNQATANLYNYTPHLSGNYNFWKLWNRYFTQKFPDGSLLQVEGELGVWLIQNGYKRPFYSKGALISRYNPNNIITISKNDLNAYPTGKPIKFPQYSLLRDPDKNMYLLEDDSLRRIVSEEVFRTIGFNYEELIDITSEEKSQYTAGEDISLNTAYPAGSLLQNNVTGAVFYVKNGIKHPVVNRYILKVNFANYHLTQVAPTELDKYPQGNLIRLQDGTLLKSYDSPDVFVISNGNRMRITSESAFNNLGYKWTNVIEVDPATITLIPEGDEIALQYLANE